jgi:uncharacterized protein YkwD
MRVRAALLCAAMLFFGATGTNSFSALSSSTSNSSTTQPATRAATETSCSPKSESQFCEDTLLAAPEEHEILMWKLINHDRSDVTCRDETKGRARILQWDARLAAVARAHSEEMARNGFFGHAGIDGSLPDVRISRAGIQWRASGENIAKFPDVSEAETAFMNEPKFQPNHRANILNPDFTHVGVGIAKGQDGMFYITQEFAQLR